MDHYRRALRNSFVSDAVNRLHQKRGDEVWLENALHARGTLFFVLSNDRIYTSQRLKIPPHSLPFGIAGKLVSQANNLILLGEVEKHLYFALAFDQLPSNIEESGQLVDLRDIAPHLDAVQSALLAQAQGMLFWHNSNRYCSRCGSRTASTQAGYMRVCENPECGQLHFPRTDPAIIVRVTNDNQCLLGRQGRWPEGRYSNIAGFVEPGESLETAVAREVWEEAGIHLASITYHSSQPWPFPSSLMLGFTATADTRDIKRQDSELEDARWFTREEIRDGLLSGELTMPSTYSISFHLIEDWFDAESHDQLADLVIHSS